MGRFKGKETITVVRYERVEFLFLSDVFFPAESRNLQSKTSAESLKVIITSFLFPEGKFSLDRLKSVLAALDNDTSKLVIDLSCRRKGATWFVAMNKWQTLTDMELTAGKSSANGS